MVLRSCWQSMVVIFIALSISLTHFRKISAYPKPGSIAEPAEPGLPALPALPEGSNLHPEAAIKSSSEASFNVGGQSLAANSHAHSDHDPQKGPALIENHAKGSVVLPANCGPMCNQQCQPQEAPPQDCHPNQLSPHPENPAPLPVAPPPAHPPTTPAPLPPGETPEPGEVVDVPLGPHVHLSYQPGLEPDDPPGEEETPGEAPGESPHETHHHHHHHIDLTVHHDGPKEDNHEEKKHEEGEKPGEEPTPTEEHKPGHELVYHQEWHPPTETEDEVHHDEVAHYHPIEHDQPQHEGEVAHEHDSTHDHHDQARETREEGHHAYNPGSYHDTYRDIYHHEDAIHEHGPDQHYPPPYPPYHPPPDPHEEHQQIHDTDRHTDQFDHGPHYDVHVPIGGHPDPHDPHDHLDAHNPVEHFDHRDPHAHIAPNEHPEEWDKDIVHHNSVYYPEHYLPPPPPVGYEHNPEDGHLHYPGEKHLFPPGSVHPHHADDGHEHQISYNHSDYYSHFQDNDEHKDNFEHKDDVQQVHNIPAHDPLPRYYDDHYPPPPPTPGEEHHHHYHDGEHPPPPHPDPHYLPPEQYRSVCPGCYQYGYSYDPRCGYCYDYSQYHPPPLPPPPPPPPPPSPPLPPPPEDEHHHDYHHNEDGGHHEVDGGSDEHHHYYDNPPPEPEPRYDVHYHEHNHNHPDDHHHPIIQLTSGCCPIVMPTKKPTTPAAGTTLAPSPTPPPKFQWAYKETDLAYGPPNWKHLAPLCGGQMQSPIDMSASNSATLPLQSGIAMEGIEGMIRGKLSNNGKTIGFAIDNSIDNNAANDDHAAMLTVQGETYTLKQFHLHFGCGGEPGSEHALDGQKFAGEVHLVFQNTLFPNQGNALKQPNGLAILAFFVKIDPGAPPNAEFRRFAENVMNVQQPGDVLPMPGGFSMTGMVPHFTEGLRNLRRFVYKGSLPTPPCYESVTWVIFNRPILLNGETVNKFSSVMGAGQQPLCGNFRPIQPANGREVKYFAPAGAAGPAGAPGPTGMPMGTTRRMTTPRMGTTRRMTTRRRSTPMG
eukprot:TCONS_00067466-protein